MPAHVPNSNEQQQDNNDHTDTHHNNAKNVLHTSHSTTALEHQKTQETAKLSTASMSASGALVPGHDGSLCVAHNVDLPSTAIAHLMDVNVRKLPEWMRPVFVHLCSQFTGEEETEILRNWAVFEMSMASIAVRT